MDVPDPEQLLSLSELARKYADRLRGSLQRYSPTPTWGLHPLDISLVQGNMISLIERQTKAWQTRQ